MREILSNHLHFKGSFNEKKRDLYEKACKFIEISQNYIYIGYVKIVFPLTTVPYLVTSYFKYYTTDLGSDAFSLPFIMWYVEHVTLLDIDRKLFYCIVPFKDNFRLANTNCIHFCFCASISCDCLYCYRWIKFVVACIRIDLFVYGFC